MFASHVVAPRYQNKLQAHKSSYQAWKCVSFGFALLTMVLLFSKWQEVSTDLHLLARLEKILASDATQPPIDVPPIWPPVDDSSLEPDEGTNSTDTGMGDEEVASGSVSANKAGSNSSDSGMRIRMQLVVDREQNGNSLLSREVELFIAEFRSARSTLVLSLLLVSVYLVSWMLMTLAINDKRISNDISLRNILLLSVFGAIDLAASIGFVMVRLIMYNVKNNLFKNEIIESAGLKDSPVKLSADQFTSFTALRLIAMRSSASYMDIYVSILVSSLTLLRIYAITRALTYYKRLRKLGEPPFHLINDSLLDGAGSHLAGESKLSSLSSFKIAHNPMPSHQHPASAYLLSPAGHHRVISAPQPLDRLTPLTGTLLPQYQTEPKLEQIVFQPDQRPPETSGRLSIDPTILRMAEQQQQQQHQTQRDQQQQQQQQHQQSFQTYRTVERLNQTLGHASRSSPPRQQVAGQQQPIFLVSRGSPHHHQQQQHATSHSSYTLPGW